MLWPNIVIAARWRPAISISLALLLCKWRVSEFCFWYESIFGRLWALECSWHPAETFQQGATNTLTPTSGQILSYQKQNSDTRHLHKRSAREIEIAGRHLAAITIFGHNILINKLALRKNLLILDAYFQRCCYFSFRDPFRHTDSRTWLVILIKNI